MRLACALSTTLLVACAGTIKVETSIVHPAALDVSAVGPLTVVHGTDDTSSAVASQLVAELRARGVAADERSTAAPASELSGNLLVVEVILTTTIRTEWTTRPENVCGLYGCYIRNVSQPFDMPYLVASYALRLEDGPTRRVIEATAGVTETMGTSDSHGRRRIIGQLVEKVLNDIEAHGEVVRLAFESIGDDALDRVVEGVQSGGFEQARAAVTASLTRADLDDDARARLHYDLALLIAYDPSSAGQADAEAAALEHAEASVRLDPTRRHIEALERVRTLASEARIQSDRRARGQAPGMPSVPDAYRGAIPPP